MTFQTGDWVWSRETQQAGQMLDQQTLWGQTVVRVWFPDQATVRSVPATHLQPVAAASPLTAEAIQYRAAAGRVAQEEATWQTQWSQQTGLMPELNLILLLHVTGTENPR